MPTVRERMTALLRLMHAGVGVRVLPKGTAMLEVPATAQGVRRATLDRMAAEGLVTRQPTDRYEITEAGRDAVRVLDGVDELVDETLNPRPAA